MKRFTYVVMFISLSVVGVMMKVPAIVGSVAFDSFPAFLAAILLHPLYGGIVALLGHLLSSLLAGFPLGVFHYLIAFEMFALVCLFGKLYPHAKSISSILAILLNGFVLPLPFYFLMGKAFYFAVVPSLLVASVLNVLFAVLLAPRLKPMMEKRREQV